MAPARNPRQALPSSRLGINPALRQRDGLRAGSVRASSSELERCRGLGCQGLSGEEGLWSGTCGLLASPAIPLSPAEILAALPPGPIWPSGRRVEVRREQAEPCLYPAPRPPKGPTPRGASRTSSDPLPPPRPCGGGDTRPQPRPVCVPERRLVSSGSERDPNGFLLLNVCPPPDSHAQTPPAGALCEELGPLGRGEA